MRIPRRSGHLAAGRALLLAVVVAAPDRVCGAEPLETICAAFRAASQGLTSGIGKGTYRHYEAVTGGDWQGASARLDARVSGYEVTGGRMPGCGRISRVRLAMRARGRSFGVHAVGE